MREFRHSTTHYFVVLVFLLLCSEISEKMRKIVGKFCYTLLLNSVQSVLYLFASQGVFVVLFLGTRSDGDPWVVVVIGVVTVLTFVIRIVGACSQISLTVYNMVVLFHSNRYLHLVLHVLRACPRTYPGRIR